MDYSGYNFHHHQQQQQQQQPYGYDPSQIQYDQSYAAYQQYYAYNPQYAYYPNTHQPQFHYQPQSPPLHPPGVNPTAPEPSSIGPSQFRGRGGKGGRPFRGGVRGRGHGVGGGRHIPTNSFGPAISKSTAAGATSVVEPSSSVSAQTPLPKAAQVSAAPRKACCEICKVECNSPEILEQHKNGKKHKKNMKMHEQLQRRNTINGQQSGQLRTSELILTDQPKEVQESKNNGCPSENMGSQVIVDHHKEEIQMQNNAGNISEVPAEVTEGKTLESSAAGGRGLKRKKKGGKGGKYMKTNDGSRPVELPKPAQPVSFRCEMCDVKCESQVVYQSHVTGKKHLSRLKRAHSHQASAVVGQQTLSGGMAGLQALYPPDINALSNAINAQVQQGDNDPQLLLAQLLMTVLSQAQVPATAHPTRDTKPELLPVQGSSVAIQIEGGNSKVEQQVLKHPPDNSDVTPTANLSAANDQIPSAKCEAPTF
ncbi:uncharacterized protein LOC113849679 [Abrus precatorius]|uniref:Uncharacterized protein LOC113849679 n=1 Tax=Abrus precatorius TaxID=3816 RepID=A0A8B8JVY4_ABRPR|nr:uncharacterized protein LOC113849679 [Abrus precatorius]